MHKKAGIRVCSGGILGLNETLEQRVEMAFELKRLHIDSVPLNILNPVKGTPFESNEALRPLDILRTFAVFPFQSCQNALIRTDRRSRSKSTRLTSLRFKRWLKWYHGWWLLDYWRSFSSRRSPNDSRLGVDSQLCSSLIHFMYIPSFIF